MSKLFALAALLVFVVMYVPPAHAHHSDFGKFMHGLGRSLECPPPAYDYHQYHFRGGERYSPLVCPSVWPSQPHEDESPEFEQPNEENIVAPDPVAKVIYVHRGCLSGPVIEIIKKDCQGNILSIQRF